MAGAGLLLVAVGAALAAPACGDDQSDGERSEANAETLQEGLDAHVAGDLEEAEARYREVIDDDDRNAFAYYNLALVEQTTDRADDAEEHYRRAIALDPQFTSALFNLAILRTQAGATDEAMALYEQLLAIDPGNAGAHLNLGFVLQGLGRAEDAQSEFDAATAIDPSLEERIVGVDGATAGEGATTTTTGG